MAQVSSMIQVKKDGVVIAEFSPEYDGFAISFAREVALLDVNYDRTKLKENITVSFPTKR